MTYFFKPVAAMLFACYSCSVVSAQPAAQPAQPAAQSKQLAELARDASRLERTFGRSIDAIEQRKAELARQIAELDDKQSGLARFADYFLGDLERNPAEINDGKSLWRIGQMFEFGGMGAQMFEAEEMGAEGMSDEEMHAAENMGILPDPFEAMTWYKRAATWHNHIEAQYTLGLMHLEGRKNNKGFWIVSQNTAEAAKWFEQAARQDFPQAQYLLAALLAKGWGIRKNESEAEKWLAKAAGGGMKIDRAAFDKLKDTPFADWAAGVK